MLFNSLEYLLFLSIFFFVYWSSSSMKWISQNLLLLIGSYIFYSFWDYRFLILIIFSTLINFIGGKKIYKEINKSKKKFILSVCLIFNIGLIFIFKYFNFFIDSLNYSFSWISKNSIQFETLNIILPVGISFYTFQSMSYTIDIYRGESKPTKNLISFATFIAFFPQLVAGPIERAKTFLPQILKYRKFNKNQSIDGINLIIWGLFKKVVIADNLAFLTNDIFNNYSNYHGGHLILGAIYFSFQIYCDFSGYSDIAIGTAKLLGFELMSNFKFPYFSKNISEFWKNWHISLSTWFRDYVYIPLGGSRRGNFKHFKNLFIVFFLSALWHGANYTFLFWGLSHFILYLISGLFKIFHSRIKLNYVKNRIKDFISGFMTFLMVSFAWIFFRSETIEKSLDYIYIMVTKIQFPASNRIGLAFIISLLFLEFFIKKNERKIEFSKNNSFNYLIISTLSFLIISNSVNHSEFIYFKF